MRWRSGGALLCAAMHPEEPGDIYIDDRLHYQLSTISRAVLPDPEHESNGLWHWVHVDGSYLRGRPE